MLFRSLQKSKVEGLRNAYQESVQEKGADANATQNLEIKLNNATTALNKMEYELKNLKEDWNTVIYSKYHIIYYPIFLFLLFFN